jgi:hypothetical protein
MAQQAEMLQYTVRGVPYEVDRALRQEAVNRGQSLNQVIVDVLTAATIGHSRKADFSDVVGRWVPDSAFDEILASEGSH